MKQDAFAKQIAVFLRKDIFIESSQIYKCFFTVFRMQKKQIIPAVPSDNLDPLYFPGTGIAQCLQY